MTPEELDRIQHQIRVMDAIGNFALWVVIIGLWVVIIGLSVLTVRHGLQIWMEWRR
jgi:hypothetical protein